MTTEVRRNCEIQQRGIKASCRMTSGEMWPCVLLKIWSSTQTASPVNVSSVCVCVRAVKFRGLHRVLSPRASLTGHWSDSALRHHGQKRLDRWHRRLVELIFFFFLHKNSICRQHFSQTKTLGCKNHTNHHKVCYSPSSSLFTINNLSQHNLPPPPPAGCTTGKIKCNNDT